MSGPAAKASAADPGVGYVEQLLESFGLAAEAAGEHSQELEIAGVRLRLRFAGAAVRDALMPPLAHLAVEERAGTEISVLVFESADSGVPAPPLPWRPERAQPGTNPVFRYESGRCCVIAAGTGGLTAVDLDRGAGVFHLDDIGRLPANERAAPLREALHLLLARRGRWLAHAGMAGHGGRGALLVGRSGSGKSTLALSCGRAGMEIAADDYVVLEPGPPPLAHALQATAKLTRGSAELLGIGPGEVGPGEYADSIESAPKAEVPIERIAPGAFRHVLEVGALLAPTVAGLERPRLEPLGAAEGLRALAPSTLIQMRSRGAPALPALAGLTREVPCFALGLSNDPAANAAAVAEALDGV